MHRYLVCGLALVLASPAVASTGLPAAHAAVHANARVPAGTQLFFFPGANGTVNIFSSTSPNIPIQTINLGLPPQSGVGVAGTDDNGTLYVTAEPNGGNPMLMKYAAPYNGTPTVCANVPGEAVAYDGTIAAVSANGPLAEIFPPNSCVPSLEWYFLFTHEYFKAFDGAGNVYADAVPNDDNVGNHDGILTYPPGSNQAVDTGVGLPIPRTAGAILFDRSGNMVVYQLPGFQPPKPPQIALYHRSNNPAMPFDSTPYKTVVLPSNYGCSGGFFFDATKAHIFIGGYTNSSESEELTYPGFTTVRAIGGNAVCGQVGGGAVFPRAQ